MRPLWLLLLMTCLLGGPACGGGGGTPPPLVTAVSPTTIYSLRGPTLRVLAEKLPPNGTLVNVRLRAATGTPFLAGTSDTLDLPGRTDAGSVTCTVPIGAAVGEAHAFISVIAPDGSSAVSATALLAFLPQEVTGFQPGTLDGSRPQAFTITGNGFLAAGSPSVTVEFESTAGSEFHVGIATSPTVSVPATAESQTVVTGTLPYAGVLAPTQARVTVKLANSTDIVSADAPASFLPGTEGIQGTLRFERVAKTSMGLDYGSITQHPIRGARVQLIRAATGHVITTRTASATGTYFIDYGVAESVFLRVLAETGPGHPPIRVEDNTDQNALWAADGPPFDTLAGVVDHDELLTTGWDGASYTAPRSSAPFAIMDVAYQGMAVFLAARPTLTFPLFTARWSPNNRPEDGDRETGQIGGAHYEDGVIYLSGKADVDTDEFDSHVVAHEWGHFVIDRLSRSDSIAGPHFIGTDLLDPGVAFGEGVATALAAMVLSPDTTYTDSMGVGQADGWGLDTEDSAIEFANAGWFSETSCAWLLYDLFDSVNEGAYDGVTLGLGPLIDVLTGTHKDTPYSTTIFSFLAALKGENATAATAIDTLCAHHGIDAVVDALGTGETHDGGLAENLPVYHALTIDGDTLSTSFVGNYAYNAVESNRRFYFTGPGGPVTVTANTVDPGTFIDDHDVALLVWREGVFLEAVNGFYYGDESITLSSTVTGATYVIQIIDQGAKPGSYACTVRATSGVPLRAVSSKLDPRRRPTAATLPTQRGRRLFELDRVGGADGAQRLRVTFRADMFDAHVMVSATDGTVLLGGDVEREHVDAWAGASIDLDVECGSAGLAHGNLVVKVRGYVAGRRVTDVRSVTVGAPLPEREAGVVRATSRGADGRTGRVKAMTRR